VSRVFFWKVAVIISLLFESTELIQKSNRIPRYQKIVHCLQKTLSGKIKLCNHEAVNPVQLTHQTE
jgi:hypothetical protein